jgi:hypothetical protein
MRTFALLLFAVALDAQTVAIVNGKPVDEAELQAFKASLPPQMAAIAGSQESLLRYYGFVNRMAELAEKEGLASRSPYKEQLALQRKQILSQAMATEYGRDTPVTPEDEQKFYDAHRDLFVIAAVTAVRAPEKPATALSQVRRYDDSLPSAIRDAVFAAKPGELTRPITLPDGVYVFRVERFTPQPLQEVRGYVAKAVSDDRFQSWMAAVTKSVTVEKPR